MRSNSSIALTYCIVTEGWITCLNLVPSRPCGGLKIRLKTGPVAANGEIEVLPADAFVHLDDRGIGEALGPVGPVPGEG